MSQVQEKEEKKKVIKRVREEKKKKLWVWVHRHLLDVINLWL